MANPAPFVRWVGGSQKSLPALLTRLPADVAERRYVDPFLGGGALFWSLRPQRALLSDACAPLMAAWRALALDPEGLIRELGVLEALRSTRSLSEFGVTLECCVSWTSAPGLIESYEDHWCLSAARTMRVWGAA